MEIMSENTSKQKVLQSALHLFYQKGFHATSVRDIAERAGVNLSLISYYFKSKQGLFEYIVVHYYEAYLKEMQEDIGKNDHLSPLDQLKALIFTIIQYKQENKKFSCFIHRELSMDSSFIREVFLTYVAKENYYLKSIFTELISNSHLNPLRKDFLFMQLKGMLAVPYIHQREFHQTLDHFSKDEYFVKNYTETIFSWLEIVARDG